MTSPSPSAANTGDAGNQSLFVSTAIDAALIDGGHPLEILHSALLAANDKLIQRFNAGTPAAELLRQRSYVVDAIIVRAWRYLSPRDEEALALVAVGGYGRGELHPGSDIDLLILTADEIQVHHEQRIASFLALLWDIGLEVGHSVRTVNECVTTSNQDVTVITNVMESRLLAGSNQLFNRMCEAISPAQIWPSTRFFEAKRKEQENRHHKYNDTAYNLEPNVKEGPGGLRDIQVIAWVAKRHFGVKTLGELVTHKFITVAEFKILTVSQEFLWRVRFALHVTSKRREDRLLFDYQQAIAEQFAYHDSEQHLAVEHFMRDFYRTTMEVNRLNEMLLQLFEEALLFKGQGKAANSINRRFRVRNGYVEVTRESVFRRYPFALMEIFLILAQSPELKGVRATTVRLIRNHRYLIDDRFRNDLRNRCLFMEILRQPRGITHELRRMNRYGVLSAYIPVFGRIIGQMQYDLFHVYTVDEHSLQVVNNIRRFFVPRFHKEFPLCSDIAKKIPKPEILYLAGLFHDIGKGRGGDHSILGATDARAFCSLHDMSQHDARLVAWLVRHHLLLSMTAQRKDINDPQIVTEFAQLVGDQIHLDYLYLLTVADIRATNPNLWNSWKDTLLARLYVATWRVLRRGFANPIDAGERICENQKIAQTLLHKQGIRLQHYKTLWKSFDSDYFLRYAADEIANHTQIIMQRSDEDLPIVLVNNYPQRGGTEIFIYSFDIDYLFATSTRLLDQMGLNILDARILTTSSGFTLDSYTVLDESGAPVESPRRIIDIIDRLKAGLANPSEKTPHVNRRRTRRLKHFSTPTQIDFITDERSNFTVMEITAADRPGLLSRVGEALVCCAVRLKNAKITTIGERVEDIFYITDEYNQPLRDSKQLECLNNNITRLLADA